MQHMDQISCLTEMECMFWNTPNALLFLCNMKYRGKCWVNQMGGGGLKALAEGRDGMVKLGKRQVGQQITVGRKVEDNAHQPC